ncbi:MAG TPA: zf-HC2 domain-containing protein [Terriglobales bacterium]|nr:zf-HC2 domain-containing protein [Terriglobales bacterium]
MNHPDPDLLTAFAERSLPERERSAVIDHLARCGECRDVLAFALPPAEPVETSIRSAPGAWLTWPALRWGFAIAGIVIVAALGALEVQHHTGQGVSETTSGKTVMVAKDNRDKEIGGEVPTRAAAAATTGTPERVLVAPQALSADRSPDHAADSAGASAFRLSGPRSESLAPERRTMARAVPPPGKAWQGDTVGAPAMGTTTFNPVMPERGEQQGLVRGRAFPVAPSGAAAEQNVDVTAKIPAASQTVEVNGPASRINSQIVNSQINEDSQALQTSLTNQSGAQLSSGEVSSLSKAKPAMQQSVGGPLARASLSAPVPRWTITSTGALQRSFDRGNTWEDVDVTASAASSLAFNSASARETETGVLKKDQKQTTAPSFRAVAVTGVDVWAGGSGGALYHSIDAGTHWVRVLPSATGSILTGDVVSLEFSDAQHGTVRTSTPEVWITSDDGQTWQKQ